MGNESNGNRLTGTLRHPSRPAGKSPSLLILPIILGCLPLVALSCNSPACPAPSSGYHLCVELFDRVSDTAPMAAFTDNNSQGLQVNLHQLNAADKAARVDLVRGSAYQPGDHVLLLRANQAVDTDTVTDDPLADPNSLDLNTLDFADTAEAVRFDLANSRAAHLRLDLYDTVQQSAPNLTLYDWDAGSPGALIALQPYFFVHKAARAKVTQGSAYHEGDHVRLTGAAQIQDTDIVTVDPAVAPDVDLNYIPLTNQPHWADDVGGVQFVLNPGVSSRLRLDLFDDVKNNQTQLYPNLTLYDWEVGQGAVLDLGHLDFSHKAAEVAVTRGPGYREGDHVRFSGFPQPQDTDIMTVDPAVAADLDLNYVPLNGGHWADNVGGVDFVRNPGPTARLRLDLYDRTRSDPSQRYPNLSLYDWEFTPNTVLDLGRLNFSHKTAEAIVTPGSSYQEGDHVRLSVAAQTQGTDIVTVDPAVAPDVDLNYVTLNGSRWADNVAGVTFDLNPGQASRLRLDLYDRTRADPGQRYPNLSLYDWESPPGSVIDLGPVNFFHKAAEAVVTEGKAYREGDHVRLMGHAHVSATDVMTVDPAVVADVDLSLMPLNGSTWADNPGGVLFQLDPIGTSHLRADLYDTLQQGFPNLTLYDWEAHGSEFDLNTLNFADKTARVVITEGSGYVSGDSITLFDEYNKPGTATWSVSPTDRSTDINLNSVGFADRAASLRFATQALPQPMMRVAIQPATAPVPVALRTYVVTATDQKTGQSVQGTVWIAGQPVAATGVPFQYKIPVGFRVVGPDHQPVPVAIAVTVKAPGYADGVVLVGPGP